MAATIAEAWGHDSSRTKYTHRLGSQAAEVRAATWRTSTTVRVNRDGSGVVWVIRDNKTIHEYHFPAEKEKK